ncbi:MAG: hypothetical protein A2085_09285 [Gemmatimonadetes bacterium GWC2_71_10]|nr:MAG: hypothetical protein A2085_09285 [Gemmatimonadetes bacterium GWC2_71_10]
MSAPTRRTLSATARRTNSRLPSSPASSPVKNANWMVAAWGRAASTRAASSSALAPLASSSAPGPPSTESKWLLTTYTRSGWTVPRSVAMTLAVRTPRRGSNHCSSGW